MPDHIFFFKCTHNLQNSTEHYLFTFSLKFRDTAKIAYQNEINQNFSILHQKECYFPDRDGEVHLYGRIDVELLATYKESRDITSRNFKLTKARIQR